MEKKESYTLKEVILGLRPEYLANQQQLQYLKDLCDVDYKKVEDFHFQVDKFSIYNPVLECYYKLKRNCLQKKIDGFIEKLDIFSNNYTRMITDNNRYYFWHGGFPLRKFPIQISSSDSVQKSFYSQASKILNSEFANNMDNSFYGQIFLDIEIALKIWTSKFILDIEREKDNPVVPYCIKYDALTDTLKFESFEDLIHKDTVQKAWDIAIPSKSLNDYQIKTITESEDTSKEIQVEDFEAANSINFDIQTDKDNFILRRTR